MTTPPKPHIAGLDLFRGLAVLLMVLAHAARLHAGMPALQAGIQAPAWHDWPFLLALTYEPLISSMFLFIAGASMVTARSRAGTAAKPLQEIWRRSLTLYGLSVLFFAADQGVQWPAMWVSSGVLAIIALALVSTDALLRLQHRAAMLAGLIVVSTALGAWLDATHTAIPGLNAGAGGVIPLVSHAWAGALFALIHARWAMPGLQVAVLASVLAGVIAWGVDAPWITTPPISQWQWPGNEWQSVLASLTALGGLLDSAAHPVTLHYWNHGATFLWRVLPLLGLGLLIAYSVENVHARLLRFWQWIGRESLNLYILHLVLLAAITVAGWQPRTGVQALLMVASILATAPWVLRYVSFVPLRIRGPAS